MRRWWTRRNLGVVAAIEHFTAVLGNWILVNTGLDAARADPEMLDLLRWHGAEEVEHRALAIDVHQAVGGRYLQRLSTMLVSGPSLAAWWLLGVRYLLAHDPSLQDRRFSWRDYRRAVRQDRLPSARDLLRGIPGCLSPGFNPRDQHSSDLALEYLASSPAA